MTEQVKSSEDRLLAALAHGSIVIQGVGILVGIFLYLTRREKSRFVAFQGLQAAMFQFVNFAVIIFALIAITVLQLLSVVPLIMQAETNPDAAPPAIFWISLLLMILPLVHMLVVWVVGLWAALRTWQGADFRYPLLGSWLERSAFWQTGLATTPAE